MDAVWTQASTGAARQGETGTCGMYFTSEMPIIMKDRPMRRLSQESQLGSPPTETHSVHSAAVAAVPAQAYPIGELNFCAPLSYITHCASVTPARCEPGVIGVVACANQSMVQTGPLLAHARCPEIYTSNCFTTHTLDNSGPRGSAMDRSYWGVQHDEQCTCDKHGVYREHDVVQPHRDVGAVRSHVLCAHDWAEI